MDQMSITPLNSLIFVSDATGGETPEITRERTIWRTSSCLAVPTYPEQDGETLLKFGPLHEVHPGRSPDLDTVIDTPTRTLIVETAETEILAQAPVSSRKTRVAVWLSHPLWPEEILIGFD